MEDRELLVATPCASQCKTLDSQKYSTWAHSDEEREEGNWKGNESS
jgi:hypothetical protein